jgi:hypothetical protein
MGRCKGCGSKCHIPGCEVCIGKLLCMCCVQDGKQLIQGQVIRHGVLIDAVVPQSEYPGTTYQL